MKKSKLHVAVTGTKGKTTTLQEQAVNISSFLQSEGTREIQLKQWQQSLKPVLRCWVENKINKTGYFEHILWSEEDHHLILSIQNGRLFFLWKGKKDLFDLWLDDQELLLLPIMERWQKREWQYWEFPRKPGYQIKFLWLERIQTIDLFA